MQLWDQNLDMFVAKLEHAWIVQLSRGGYHNVGRLMADRVVDDLRMINGKLETADAA